MEKVRPVPRCCWTCPHCGCWNLSKLVPVEQTKAERDEALRKHGIEPDAWDGQSTMSGSPESADCEKCGAEVLLGDLLFD